jgi:hypothetical protein
MGEGCYRESDIGLPPLFTLRGFEGTLQDYVDALYWQYRALVDHASTRLWGRPLLQCSKLAEDGRESQFWHLITTGAGRGPYQDRKLCLMRSARLPWVWDMLERLERDDPRVCWWRDSRRRLLVASVDFRQLVVLRDKRESFYLETAYPIGRKHRARTMAQAAASWESGASVREDRQHPKWRIGSRQRGTRPPARQLLIAGRRP